MAGAGFRVVALGTLALSVGVSACGEPAAVDLRGLRTAVRQAGAPTAGEAIVLQISEFRVRPQRVLVRPGALQIEVRNVGILAHEFAVGQGVMILNRTGWLKPGQSAVLTLQATPGLYRDFDPTGNNDAAGLSGSITVG